MYIYMKIYKNEKYKVFKGWFYLLNYLLSFSGFRLSSGCVSYNIIFQKITSPKEGLKIEMFNIGK